MYHGTLHGTPVAVKKFKAVDFNGMAREVTILKKIRHPNVVLLMGCCPEEKSFVSEYMSGGSLQDRLKDKMGAKYRPFSWEDRLRMVRQVLHAVLYLHKVGVLHRDLKPSNLLLDSHGTIKVADMGLAKLGAENKFASERGRGLLLGTPG